MNTTSKTIGFVIVTVLVLLVTELLVGFDALRVYHKDSKQAYDVLYLSDSVEHTMYVHDTDFRTVGEMLDDMTEERTVIVSHGSYNPPVYAAFTDYVLRHDHPEVIIVGLNLRSFSLNQYTRPRYVFTLEQDKLRGEVVRALGYRFRNLFYMTPQKLSEQREAWLSQPVDYDGMPAGTVRDYDFWLDGTEPDREEKIAQWYRFIYGYELQEYHPYLASLKELAALADAANVTFILYVTPIDGEDAERLVPGISSVVQRNVAVINETLMGTGAIFLDFSHSLPDERFIFSVMPDEHLDDQGRLWLAAELAAALENASGGPSLVFGPLGTIMPS